MRAATITDRSAKANGKSSRLTETLKDKLSHPATSPDFDLKKGANEVLADVGLTSDDCGGELSFYGSDPILQSPLRSGQWLWSVWPQRGANDRIATGAFGS